MALLELAFFLIIGVGTAELFVLLAAWPPESEMSRAFTVCVAAVLPVAVGSVVLHELGGHGVLYNHVHSANFGFSHSAGDSIAAILADPGTKAPDRFVTFPWVNIGRRHGH